MEAMRPSVVERIRAPKDFCVLISNPVNVLPYIVKRTVQI